MQRSNVATLILFDAAVQSRQPLRLPGQICVAIETQVDLWRERSKSDRGHCCFQGQSATACDGVTLCQQLDQSGRSLNIVSAFSIWLQLG